MKYTDRFPDRISELNYIYGFGVMAAIFDDYTRTMSISDFRFTSQRQGDDQMRAGIRDGQHIQRTGVLVFRP